MKLNSSKTEVKVLILDDEVVTCSSVVFDASGNLRQERIEFNYALHPEFLTHDDSGNAQVKTLHFNDGTASILFKKVLDLFTEAVDSTFWLVFLDLNWAQAGTASEDWEKLSNEHKEEINGNQRHGMVFAKYALSLNTWRGLICIATGNTNPNDANTNNSTHNDQFLDKVLGDVRSVRTGPSRINEGIEKFEQLFGSKGLIRYWLIPPCDLPTWFHVDYGNHNPKSRGCCQYKDLPKCFGASQWWEADQGKFTKPLFEIEKSAMAAKEPTHKSRNIKAGMVPLLFRNSIILDGLKSDAEVAIPVQPGLPFLFAVKEAFEKAREENNEQSLVIKDKPLLLREEAGKIMICLRQTKDASDLVNKVNTNSINPEDDGVSGAIYRALHAKVIPPIDLATRAGCVILNGTKQPVASIEWAADMSELRIFWPVSNERKPQ